MTPSHVLSACGVRPDIANAAIRMSLGSLTTDAHIDRVAQVFPTLVQKARGQVPGLLGRPGEPEFVPELQPVGRDRVLAAGDRTAGVPAFGLSHGAATARSG